MRTILLSVVAGLSLAGCFSQTKEDPDVLAVRSSDAEMNAAILRAQETFPCFVEHWDSMQHDGCSVKIAVETDDGSKEHIWFKPESVSESSVTGVCSINPIYVSDLKFGDRRSFARSQVSDWMIIVGDQCYGGYTIRAAIKQNPGAAQSAPYEFVEPDS